LGPACRDQRMVGDLPGAGGGGRVAGGEQRADHLTAGQVPAAGVGDECPVPARRGDAVGRVPSTLLVGGAPIAVSAAVSRRAVTGGADWHRRDRSNRGLQHGQGERAGRGTRAAIAAAARSVREGPAGAGGGGGGGSPRVVAVRVRARWSSPGRVRRVSSVARSGDGGRRDPAAVSAVIQLATVRVVTPRRVATASRWSAGCPPRHVVVKHGRARTRLGRAGRRRGGRAGRSPPAVWNRAAAPRHA
jgi:hypothetical protein